MLRETLQTTDCFNGHEGPIAALRLGAGLPQMIAS